MPEALVVDDTIADLAPSRKLVHLVLVSADAEWLPRSEIVERTHLDPKTVRDCLKDLRDHNLAERRPLPSNPRGYLHRAPPE